jgi:hypothetical protein
MTDYDVFNGDAEGICALVQLRLNDPRDSVLVTGVKRDINLLSRVDADLEDRVTVLDVSLDKNRDDLIRILKAGASVHYVDHHFAGDIPTAKNLNSNINTAPDVCTSLLINGELQSAFVNWAIVGAFGDNLHASAQALARVGSLTGAELLQLQNLGIYINYNGYGSGLDDLHFTPDDLYQRVSPYADPLRFIAESQADFERLEVGYQQDMASAAAVQPVHQSESAAVFILPNEAWARRVSGVYSNDLANEHPERGHAVLTEKAGGTYLVSVRAPLANKVGADELCRQFPTGGGRAAAAGINDLPADILGEFVDTFSGFYPR